MPDKELVLLFSSVRSAAVLAIVVGSVGLALAKKTRRPICLVFYTEWCGHCRNYKKVFTDERVVDVSKQLVMIRLDKDKHKTLSAKYAVDGEYIPRTYFLSPDGVLDPTIHAARSRYKYFYSERDPADVLGAMQKAIELFATNR